MRTKLFKIAEWDKYEELGKKEYEFRLSIGARASIPTDYEEYKRKMITGDITERKVEAALLLRKDIYNLQWYDEYHGYLTHVDHPFYDVKPDIKFEMHGKTVVADIKTIRYNDVIRTVARPQNCVDIYKYIKAYVFHDADILISINKQGELRFAYLEDYYGTDNTSSMLFHTHPFEEFNYVQTIKER